MIAAQPYDPNSSSAFLNAIGYMIIKNEGSLTNKMASQRQTQYLTEYIRTKHLTDEVKNKIYKDGALSLRQLGNLPIEIKRDMITERNLHKDHV